MPTTSPALMVAGSNGFERLVDDERLAVRLRRGRGQHVQPARRDDADAERDVARVDEVDVHRVLGEPGRTALRLCKEGRQAVSITHHAVEACG